MRLAFGGCGVLLVVLLVGCAGHSTTRPTAGDDPADTGPKVTGSMPPAAEGADAPPSGVDIDYQVDPSSPLPPGPVGIGVGTGGGASAGGGRPGSGPAPGASGTGGSAVARAGSGGSGESGGEGGSPATGSTTVPLTGPRADYTLATFVSSPAPEDDESLQGNGWLSTESILAERTEVAVPRGATLAAVLVSSSGTIVDAAVSSCESRPPSPGVRMVPGAHPTIQAALDAATPGDTILVAPGIYFEHLRLPPFVTLRGSGAGSTILDGEGTGESLIDFTGATSAVVSGFTLQNVGQRDDCAGTAPTECSGDWYSAAVYADGHADGCGTESSILFTRNIVKDSDVGFLLYFHARAIVTNNIFLRNNYGFVANHHQDHSLVAQNVFYENSEVAVMAQASYLSVIGNIMANNGDAYSEEFVQQGFVGCNVLATGDAPGTLREGAFSELVPDFVAPETLDFRLAEDSMARGLGCLGPDHDIATDPGAFGGPLGNWSPMSQETP